MELNSVEYYRMRERQERVLADGACDPAIAAIHRDMAERYAELIGQAEPGRRARAPRSIPTIDDQAKI